MGPIILGFESYLLNDTVAGPSGIGTFDHVNVSGNEQPDASRDGTRNGADSLRSGIEIRNF